MNITTVARSFSKDEVACSTAVPDAMDEADAEAEAPLSADELFHLLQNSRRRAVIRYLQGREGPVEMREVTEQVAAWEHDTTVAQLTSTERQRVYIALYQSHLETLEDAGVLEYNKPRGIIEPEPLLDRVAVYVNMDPPVSTDADAGSGPWSLRSPASTDTDVTSDPWPVGDSGLSLVSGVTAGVLSLLLFIGLAKLALDGDEPAEPGGNSMSKTDARQSGAEPMERVIYRWSCPYCGESWVSHGTDEEIVCRRAHIAIQSHVCITAENGHGPRHATPDDFHPAARYLERRTG